MAACRLPCPGFRHQCNTVRKDDGQGISLSVKLLPNNHTFTKAPPTIESPSVKLLPLQFINTCWNIPISLQVKRSIKASGRKCEVNKENEELNKEEKHHVKTGQKPLSPSQTKQKDFKKKRDKKSFICTQCGKSCTKKHSLEIHMRIHTGEKPFTCDQCEKSFTQSSNLKKHMIVHTGEKPFTCDQCHTSFTQSSNLKKHMIVHTGEKPFTCDQCEKSFTQSSNLQRHMIIHTEEKLYECDQC
ncbi:gastrula zinc finger protein XlCGF7.1-like [Carassius carassius]|uniref:gastrula zinc finger protein XlCGF7.1-like n=1 Tax=Carassius carassius TaxID=217509 RepID=UPI0028692A27|nr:gastrula zinc finger protein XlCGF7.1-like [Carassius carassius]